MQTMKVSDIRGREESTKIRLICGTRVADRVVSCVYDRILPANTIVKNSIDLQPVDFRDIKIRRNMVHIKTNFNYVVGDIIFSGRKRKKILEKKVASKTVQFVKKLSKTKARELYGTDITHDALLISYE